MTSLRPTVAEINLGAIRHNLRELQRIAGVSKVAPVIKADAYGHGLVAVARTLEHEGADGLCVALAEEGFELREAGITRALLVLNGVYGTAHAEVIERGLTPVVFNEQTVAAFHRASNGRPVDVHLKVDTGMGRLGVSLSRLPIFLESIQAYRSVRIVGVMTHFATADEDPEFVRFQTEQFQTGLDIIRAHSHHPSVLHVANTDALLRHQETRLTWVRPGIGIYGYTGSGLASEQLPELRPALRWRTEVIRSRTLMAGESVGYGRTFVADRTMRIATLPLGYGDGLMRSSGGRAQVLIAGELCPVIGRVSMDLTTVDVTHLPGVSVGDEAVLIGTQGRRQLTADDLAGACGTSSYEVLTNVSRRVPRLYVDSDM